MWALYGRWVCSSRPGGSGSRPPDRGEPLQQIRGDIFFWGQLVAGALLGSVPIAFIYSFFVEYYVSGLVGSIKG